MDYLASVLHPRRERDEAMAHAAVALDILEHAGSTGELADARGRVAGLPCADTALERHFARAEARRSPARTR